MISSQQRRIYRLRLRSHGLQEALVEAIAQYNCATFATRGGSSTASFHPGDEQVSVLFLRGRKLAI